MYFYIFFLFPDLKDCPTSRKYQLFKCNLSFVLFCVNGADFLGEIHFLGGEAKFWGICHGSQRRRKNDPKFPCLGYLRLNPESKKLGSLFLFQIYVANVPKLGLDGKKTFFLSQKGPFLAKSDVKVQKLSPVVIKKYMEHQ